jgi:hypothetical protein
MGENTAVCNPARRFDPSLFRVVCITLSTMSGKALAACVVVCRVVVFYYF